MFELRSMRRGPSRNRRAELAKQGVRSNSPASNTRSSAGARAQPGNH